MALVNSKAIFIYKMNFKTKNILTLVLIGLISVFGSFSCDIQHGLRPVPLTGISGKITYIGDWPNGIDMLRLVCFEQKPDPNNIVDLVLKLMEAKISDELPQNVNSYRFEVELDPGMYNWIIVILSAKNHPFTVLGEYTGSDTSSTSVPVTIKKEKLLLDINISADFTKLNSP